MPDTSTPFYLTTPIYYVNARPHIGHTYTTVVSDAIARRRRLLGQDVWFLTGTDEHGQKIERSAEKAGIAPQQFTDQVSAEFRGLWDQMGLTYDDYIRTTEERHKRGVHKLWNVLKERGYLYKGTYTGQYCVWDELYVEAGPGAACPDCGRITETVSEENYFFKLSAFENRLLELYAEQPGLIQPETRRNEVLAFVRGGLRDLSVSRTSFKWGIPVPGDESHVIYVWLDALANYITALGYGSEDESAFHKYWPAQLHIIGKEISRFHCVYWPAFLMAAGLPLPTAVVAHGWLLFEQSKMSKSRGNIVRSETILAVLGADALRYFLLREIVFGQDGSFSFDALVQRYNADLANGLGNLVSRTLAMIEKYFSGVIPEASAAESIQAAAEQCIQTFGERFDALDFSRALESAWALVAVIDGYISEQAPWKLAKQADAGDEASREQLKTVLAACAEAIRVLTALVYPVLPEAAAKIWTQLGLGDLHQADLKDLHWGGLQPGARLGALGPVFPRADKDAAERMQAMEQDNARNAAAQAAETAPASPTTPQSVPAPVDQSISHPNLESGPVPVSPATALATPPEQTADASLPLGAFMPGLGAMEDAAIVGQITTPAMVETANVNDAPAAARPDAVPQITIDDFLKVELRVAQILVAERVPKADKLLRLEVDLGYEQRQILAGIAETYAPESLVGRKVVIVANLAPRKLRGFESNGMVVAASLGEHGKPSLAGFLDHVEIGARLK
ncbi:methionine--tRNA ligase [Acidipila sp. EB88]|uniref:methionine--tRNA ligase n=1 Tax=Acidipila sp. EB88 TaxID=2305226 RepID=UPI000F5E85A8|nr:methionine--tRNA ligase [Acidipila sp. EB88]RRA47379.1 methionine--tRNA ligase [Acidipila sp. EB88]